MPHQTTLQTARALPLSALALALLSAFASTAGAAGFQSWEQNAAGIATSQAGSAAGGDTAASQYYNPAATAELKGIQFSAGTAGVSTHYRFHNAGSTDTGGSGSDAGKTTSLPSAFISTQLTSGLSLGLGVATPFSLQTDYSDAAWMGRKMALKSDISSRSITPSLAWRINDRVAIGAGLNYQKLDVELTSSLSRFKGDDNGLGWNAGALFTLSPSMRVGVSYRSAVSYNLDGQQNGVGVHTRFKTPDTFTLSVWQQVSDRWEAMGDLSWTGWRKLDGITINGEQLAYNNAWRFAWGAAYKVQEGMKLKFGLGYERTPTSDASRTARLPENSALRLSFGGQWKPSASSSIDAGYAYLYQRDARIGQTAGGQGLRGDFANGTHILGLQYSQGF